MPKTDETNSTAVKGTCARAAPTTVTVSSPNVTYTAAEIRSTYTYETTEVSRGSPENPHGVVARPVRATYEFKTTREVPRVGLMMVGLAGNNGTTLTAGILANKMGLSWHTRTGVEKANWYGSFTQCAVTRLGATREGEEVNVPIKEMLPMASPNDLIIGGWDINSADLASAMERAQVIDYDLQRQLAPLMAKIRPLPSVYFPDFIAANQEDRADNTINGTKGPCKTHQQMLDHLRRDIQSFKESNLLDKVIVLWTATTERYCELRAGLNDTADNLLAAIARGGETEIAPSTLFAAAAVLEGCCYINGSPQNTLVPAIVELAERHKVYVMGDDFKTGQTKLKSVLADFLVGAGLKLSSVVSYNHLGNNDGKNLSSPAQFRSKEISKSNVIDDVVHGNRVLYQPGEKPDHVVVIKYVPAVGDSKRAMDEYTSEIFLGGRNTLVIHNTCEDSLLAAGVMIDLVVLMELCTRIKYRTEGMKEFQGFETILSLLSYFLKAPMVPKGTPVVNALGRQRECLENFLRACVGLPPINNMLLEAKTDVTLA